MANNDLVVRLNGNSKGFQDSINSAKDSLKGLQQESSKLDSFQQRFDKITNSTKPMKKQLADLRGLLAEMNREGLNSSDVFTQIAQKAGSLADNIGDAQAAVKAFADDNFNLQASAQAFEVVAAGGAMVTGAMAMMGVESDKAAEVIAKVQGAIALLNGVQTISNLLNKDSALMLKLKQIQLKVNEAQTKKNTVAQVANNVSEATSTATTTASTVATAANTTATAVNTTATTASTVAQNAWNVAKAIGKAMMYDFSGLILLAAAGIMTYSIATSNSTDKVEENTKAVNKQTKEVEYNKKAFTSYAEAVGNETSNLVGSFKRLTLEWQAAKTAGEDLNTILPKVQSFFKGLGIEIKDVNEANKVLVENNSKVIQALEAQAKARGATKASEEIWSQYYKDVSTRTANRAPNLKADSKLSDYGDDEAMQEYIKQKIIPFIPKTINGGHSNPNWDKIQKGIVPADYNNYAYSMAKEYVEMTNQAQLKAAEEAEKMLYSEIISNQSAANAKWDELGLDKVKDDDKDPIITPPKPTPEPQKEKTPLELYNELKQKASVLQQMFDVGFLSSSEATKELEELNKEVDKLQNGLKQLTLDFHELSDLDIYKNFNNQFNEIQNRFNKGLIDKNTAEKSVKELNQKLEEKLGKNAKKFELEFDIKPNITINSDEQPDFFNYGSIYDKRASLSNANSIIDKTKFDLKNGIITQQEAQSIIDDLNEKLQSIGLKPLDLKINLETNEIESQLEILNRKTEELSGVSDSIGTIGSAFSTLGNAIEGTTGQIISFGGVVISQGAQMVSQLAQIIAANQAAALAKGISSASGLAFPFNLAAIATVVATIASIFASLPKFETGGIVGGTSYSGDKILTRINSGEMILNKQQQSNLFSAISSGNLGGSGGGTVNFKIQGKELVGVLQNYNSKMSKIR